MANINDYNFAGKKAIVRVDFNVPLNEKGEITDDTRIRGALPTLKKILADGGSLILMSHMGKPKGKVKPELSLGQIVDAVSAALGVKVAFAPDCAKASEAAAALKPGEALLLENLRFYPEEEGKPVGIDKADPAYDEAKKEMKAKQKEFAKTLASYADVYVNDAFGTAHRSHGSTAAIVEQGYVKTAVCGFLIQKELTIMGGALEHPERPFVAVLGGAKVADKLKVISNLLDKCDTLVIGGGMAYTFLKGEGYEVGTSLVDDSQIGYCKELLEKAKKLGKKVYLPVDVVTAKTFPDPIDAPIETSMHDISDIPADEEGLDIGEKTRALYAEVVKSAKTVVWNGPMGVFENPILAAGTNAVAKALAEAKGATTIIGGGDSAAAVAQLGYADKMTHISTGGGASLELLEGKELPGIACLNEKE